MKRFEIHRAGKIQPRDNLQPLGLIVCSLFFEKFTLILGCLFAAGSRRGLLRLLTIVSVDEQTRVSRVFYRGEKLCELLDYFVSYGIIYCPVFTLIAQL